MSAALDRWLTRFYHAVGGSVLLALCAFGSYTVGDRQRLCRVRAAELPKANLGFDGAPRRTPAVLRGAECASTLTRRPPSAALDGRRPMLAEVALDAPPGGRDGEPRPVGADDPADFRSRPAMRVEGPPVACDRVRRPFRGRRGPDTATPFRATCVEALTGAASPPAARAP